MEEEGDVNVKDDQVYGGGYDVGGEDGCEGSSGFFGMILAAAVTMIIFIWDIFGLCKMICSSLDVSQMPWHYKYLYIRLLSCQVYPLTFCCVALVLTAHASFCKW